MYRGFHPSFSFGFPLFLSDYPVFDSDCPLPLVCIPPALPIFCSLASVSDASSVPSATCAFSFDGLTSSLLQVALPVLLYSRAAEGDLSPRTESCLHLHGGTDAEFAPPADYLRRVLLPTLRRLWGLEIEDKVGKRSPVQQNKLC